MDSRAYLERQGWRGDGHSLDHTGRGIKKPLLVSKKVDVLGVGLNKHAAVSDQWWLRAFDQGLKDLGSGKQSLLGQVQKHGIARGGLYGRFVKGEGHPGTIDSSADNTPVRANTPVEVEMAAKVAKSATGTVKPSLGKRKRGEDKDAGREDKRTRRTVDVERESRGAERAGPSAHLPASTKLEKLRREASKGSERSQKVSREKLKRELKRVANAESLGPQNGLVAVSKEKQSESSHSVEAAKTAAAEAKAARRLAKKAAKLPDTIARPQDGFTTGTDEVKLAGTRKPKHKTALGADGIARYPTKAEKRERKAQDPIAVKVKELPRKKFDAYTKRAQEKGINMEEYLRRREEKSGLKAAEATASISAEPSVAVAGDLGFVVDTAGDASLATKKKARKQSVDVAQLSRFRRCSPAHHGEEAVQRAG